MKTNKIFKHIYFESELAQQGEKAAIGKRQSFTAYLNSVLEKELIDSGYLSKHN